MWIREGKSRNPGASPGWAAETKTTTGYGSDPSWQHPLLQACVLAVLFGGLFLVARPVRPGWSRAAHDRKHHVTARAGRQDITGELMGLREWMGSSAWRRFRNP